MSAKNNPGIAYGFGAYILWGFFPVFFKQLTSVPALQVVAHRIVWSFLFYLAVLLLRGEWKEFRSAMTRRNIFIYAGAGVLLSANWLTYVWAVNGGYVLEGSLGYFINPLISVLLGVVFLRERMRPLQWVPIGLAAAAVLYLTFNYGALPWIALTLATSFGFYGLVKKISPLNSLHGLALETLVVFLPALAYLLFEEARGAGVFLHTGAYTSICLFLTGVVTAAPLLLFSAGARLIPLSILGVLQYITPSMHFLFGAWLYGEPLTSARLTGFGIIWIALVLFSLEGFVVRARRMRPVEDVT